jgi:outer membrane protein TolC
MAVRIAKYTIDAARAELLSTEQEVFLDAISAFLSVINAKEVLEINKENVVGYEKRYEAIKERVLAGVDKQADLARTAASKADAYTNLTIASGNYESALATYLKVIGVESDSLTLGDNLGQMPANQMDMLSKALVTNPILNNIIFQQKAADINVYSNAAALLPSVDVGGNIGKTWKKDSPISQPYTNEKSVYIEVSVPIYNKGLEFSKTREASARAASLKYAVRNTKSSVTQNSTQTWTSYISTIESLKSAIEAVKAGTTALDSIQQSYDEGVDKLTDLLDAQEALYSYKSKLAKVNYELGIARYKLFTVIGTLNAKDLALPTKLYNPAANYDKVKFELVGF